MNKRDRQTRSGLLLLKFLQESVSTSAGESNIDFSQQNNIDSLGLNEDPDDATPVGSIGTTRVQPYRKPITSRKKNTEDAGYSVDKMLVDSVNNVSEVCSKMIGNEKEGNRAEKEVLEDADTLFCKSLITTIQNLPPRKNRQAKIKLQQVLYEIKFDDV